MKADRLASANQSMGRLRSKIRDWVDRDDCIVSLINFQSVLSQSEYLPKQVDFRLGVQRLER
jgi:hypothetical protein